MTCKMIGGTVDVINHGLGMRIIIGTAIEIGGKSCRLHVNVLVVIGKKLLGIVHGCAYLII